MQVYVQLAGKIEGPYSIDQHRLYVHAGNLKDDHLASYEVTNWMKIKNLTGFSLITEVLNTGLTIFHFAIQIQQ